MAALQRRTETVKLLVDAGSDLDVPDKYGDPALILAVMDGGGLEKYDIVKVLVDAGATLDCKCENFKMNPLPRGTAETGSGQRHGPGGR